MISERETRISPCGPYFYPIWEDRKVILGLDLFFWKSHVLCKWQIKRAAVSNWTLHCLPRCKCNCFVPEKCQWGGVFRVREGVQTRGPRADLSKSINHLSLSFGAIRTRNATLNSGINSTIWQQPSALMNSLFRIPDQPPWPSPSLSVWVCLHHRRECGNCGLCPERLLTTQPYHHHHHHHPSLVILTPVVFIF